MTPGQMNITYYIGAEAPVFQEDDFLTWCDFCEYMGKSYCCEYNKPLGRTCIEGSGFKRRKDSE